ncbi:hypothetical protein DICA1_F18228 [Diutina catenulata]
MEESFHLGLLRVSIAQILKSCGFDKCKPSTLQVVTDLYVQYFTLLAREAVKCAQLRLRSNSVELPDVTQSLILAGAIKGSSILGADPVPQTRDNYGYNTKSLSSFVDWVKYSEGFRVSRALNEVPLPLLTNLIEKRKLDLDDIETDSERKKRKYQERQEFYNSLKLTGADDGLEDDDLITEKDRLPWVNYLIEKDLRLGHDLKFVHTPLSCEYTRFQNHPKYHPSARQQTQLHQVVTGSDKSDHIVANIDGEDQPYPPERLLSSLPYNVTYDEHLTHDLSLDAIEKQGKYTPSEEEEKVEDEEEGKEEERGLKEIHDVGRVADAESEESPGECALETDKAEALTEQGIPRTSLEHERPSTEHAKGDSTIEVETVCDQRESKVGDTSAISDISELTPVPLEHTPTP